MFSRPTDGRPRRHLTNPPQNGSPRFWGEVPDANETDQVEDPELGVGRALLFAAAVFIAAMDARQYHCGTRGAPQMP